MDLQIPSHDNKSFGGYAAYPDSGRAPTVIVIQEIFGINEEMREKCDQLAAQGYVAIAPDLFWRQEPGIELTDKTDEEWQKAFALMQGFDVDLGVRDLQSTIDFIRKQPYSNGKVGAIGYCLGGKLAYLTATRTDADCSVGYYGVCIQDLLNEAENIQNPLLLHIAEEDEFVDKDAQEKIRKSLKDHEKVTIYSYPGANHAFARGNGIHYHDESAKTANKRTEVFLKSHL